MSERDDQGGHADLERHLREPFERGDHRLTRERAQALLRQESLPEDVRVLAADLLERTRPAPLSLWLLGLTALLLAGLTALAYLGPLHG